MKGQNIVLFLIILFFAACGEKKQTSRQKVIDISASWQIFSSEGIEADGKRISSNDEFSVENAVTTDMPATVMAALKRNNKFPDLFVGMNLQKVDTNQFRVPWWYRKSFDLELDNESFYHLNFEGLNYKANIWLNGNQIASSTTVEGCFRMFDFEISEYLVDGKNTLAVEIIPPQWGDLTIGFVDWNPWPPDNNMGIWRPVNLSKTGKVSINDFFVKPDLNIETLKEADIVVSALLKNHSNNDVETTAELYFEKDTLKQVVAIKAGAEKMIYFKPEDYPALSVTNPRIWWPVNMGDPNLYNIKLQVKTGHVISSIKSDRFGIRDVEEYLTEEGYRGYKINGKKTLIKGGGWVDDIFLDDSDEKVLDQIRYVKHMNLNTIRLEGFWGKNQKIYDYADENGILIMIGWSCQWEWTDYCGRPEDEYLAIKTEDEINQHALAYEQQVKWLRNHPSIFLWVYGSDKLLVPELEKTLNSTLAEEDGTRPILNSCGSKISEVTGASGVKMNGPYSYVTPNYWYEDSTRGGAFGFNTETGPGIQPAPIQSVKRMIPEKHLWPIDSVWEYHLGRREFTTFEYWMEPFNKRYGEETSLERFALKAQMANYEAMRSMFEAFAANRPNTTGIIQWMLNSAMPSMQWQLYDWYLMPSGAFYATKKGAQPLNVVYNYANNSLYLINEYHRSFKDLNVEVKVLNIDGKIVWDKSFNVNASANESKRIQELPNDDNYSATYFLDIRLKDSEGVNQSVNFYWLSNKRDVLDFENSNWFVTQNKAFADLSGINKMTKTRLLSDFKITQKADTTFFKASLHNEGNQIAFFLELNLDDKTSGIPILPVFWEDNYISLLPGEKREVHGYALSKDLNGKSPYFFINGWNLIKE